VLWAPIASGAYHGWALALTQLLTVASLVCWTLAMIGRRRVEWRRTALDLPLAALIGLILLQLLLGNGPLVRWALAPLTAGPVTLPDRFYLVGTVAPSQTARSLLLFLTYAGVYALVVNLVRAREDMNRLLRTLLIVGSLLAFMGLLDYLAGEPWLTRWRDHPFEGRLAGTFANPDHFAAWLGMLICLGIGMLLGREREGRRTAPAQLFGSREARERLVRDYLPVVGVGVMTLALVFTLSRGGIVSLVAALVALFGILGALGRARWSLVLVGILLTVTLSYGAWIGFGPLLERFRHGPYDLRIVQSLTTLPMLASFPILGVGFGAYRDIYFRYQPPALGPGTYYLPFAHNDWLQLVVELGLAGGLVCVIAVWRVGRDLIAAHLFGRGRCPVGAGEGEGARRHDPQSVAVALGALAAVLVVAVHSAFDFGARIPANGLLAATCLGIATVALHSRFGGTGARALAAIREFRPASGSVAALSAAIVVVLALASVPPIIRPAWVEGRLAAATGSATLSMLDQAVRWAPRDAQALGVRSRVRLAAARRIWDSGRMVDGTIATGWDDRRRAARPLLDGAVEDLRTALTLTPTDPFLHETLGWVYQTMAVIDASAPARVEIDALGSLRRAIALQPENPFLYRSLAVIALSQRTPDIDVALVAGREAAERDPERLGDLVRIFLPMNLSPAQWLALAPATAISRLDLAARLERSGLPDEAQVAYRSAIEISGADLEPLARFRLAELLLRRHDAKAALGELDRALARDPKNPELHLARARSLAELGDAAALDAYRAAVEHAQAREAAPGGGVPSFAIAAPRARALAEDAGGAGPVRSVVYRRALARYLLDRKLWAQALEQWKLVVAAAPQDAAAHAGVGAAFAGLGEREQAVEAYRRAIALDARAIEVRLRLASSLWDTGQSYQAINEWRAVIGQDPGNVEAHLALARAYLATGDRVEAFREYQRVWQMVPDQPEALRALSKMGGVPAR
jgi:tetratricopeptide (TPR) repeat protein